MTLRAKAQTEHFHTAHFIVAQGETIEAYTPVKQATADDTYTFPSINIQDMRPDLVIPADKLVVPCPEGEEPMGFAMDGGSEQERIRVILGGSGVLPVKVSAGGATRSTRAKMGSGGLEDAAVVDGGDTLIWSPGVFVESGDEGDIVGMVWSPQLTHEDSGS